jgi:ABC-2 type transport system permease protein
VLGFGLFISTIAKTQQQALMATFLFFAPAILLSGFMFPIENMPAIFQYATYLNPLRYFLVIIRGIFLKGNGLDLLWQQMLSLLVLGLVLMTLSALRFKKRLG